MSAAVASLRRLRPRQRAGLAIQVALAVALVPAFIIIAPRSRWDDPALLVVLGVLAIIASRSEVPLPGGFTFDGAIALMLLAVALAGPLPAMEIVVLPVVANAVTGRRRLLRFGTPGEVANYGWQALCAAWVLQLAGVQNPTSPGALGWLVGVGFVLYGVGWAVSPAIWGPLWVGESFRAVVHALIQMLPAAAVMIVLGAATVVLTGPLGLLALGIFAAVAVVPQSFLTYAARTRPVAHLDPETATRRYAHALAVQLNLSRPQRRHLARVTAATEREPPTGHPMDYARSALGDASLIECDAQLVTEWWNGGGPIGLRARGIPHAARVLAVAQTWSALTARGTPQLGHDDALMHLQSAAGTRLDPRVVRAARAVIAEERVTATEPAPVPRLHQLRVPARLRRALAAR